MQRFVLLVALYVCISGSGAAAEQSRKPAELAWFNGTSAQLKALTEKPKECVAKPSSKEQEVLYNLGRLAFHSPRLLGGQAGRMGLSCAACHPSGRASSNFFIAQISDKPGRADISHHFLSSNGGDDVFNPSAIPDLANSRKLRFKNRLGPEFDHFLVRLITVEFDGQTPSSMIIDSLKWYLQNNDQDNCTAFDELQPRDFESDWQLIDNGLFSLRSGVNASDEEVVYFASASLRSALETVFQFYVTSGNKFLDKKLIRMSRNLESLVSQKPREHLQVTLDIIEADMAALKVDLKRVENSSLYNPASAADFLLSREPGFSD